MKLCKPRSSFFAPEIIRVEENIFNFSKKVWRNISQVWSLSKGKLLRTIDFPSIINAQKRVLLVFWWEDGTVRIWDTKSKQINHKFKNKDVVTNVIVVHLQLNSTSQKSLVTTSSTSERNISLLPPSLGEFVTPVGENDDFKTVTASQPPLSRVTVGHSCSDSYWVYVIIARYTVSYSSGFLDMFKYAISTKMEVLNLSLGGPNYSALLFVKGFIEKIISQEHGAYNLVELLCKDGHRRYP
ncbi:hypothetical protein C5167_027003 [Papaver somniferum]|nr:hypothetical protein C5167_027003 [Papaver somniferum]